MKSAFNSYFRELTKCQPISREEEHVLAVSYAQTRDAETGRRLIEANMRFVVKIARQLKRPRHELLELIQEGNCGLLRALSKFDPKRGIRFTTYASWWIRAYILNYIVANWSLIRIGKSQTERRLFFAVEREKKRRDQSGEAVDYSEMARALDASAHDVMGVDSRLASVASLDTPVSHESDRFFRDVLPDDGAVRPDIRVERTEMAIELAVRMHAFGETLRGREAEIYKERMLADEPVKLEDLGARYGITRERVRQIETRLRGKLRDYLLDGMDEGSLVAA